MAADSPTGSEESVMMTSNSDLCFAIKSKPSPMWRVSFGLENPDDMYGRYFFDTSTTICYTNTSFHNGFCSSARFSVWSRARYTKRLRNIHYVEITRVKKRKPTKRAHLIDFTHDNFFYTGMFVELPNHSAVPTTDQQHLQGKSEQYHRCTASGMGFKWYKIRFQHTGIKVV